jgi:hypothetical protein
MCERPHREEISAVVIYKEDKEKKNDPETEPEDWRFTMQDAFPKGEADSPASSHS